jgi:hypothetical protein
MDEIYIIMHAQKVLNNIFFTSEKKARNYIMMQNPKRRFKEFPDNIFTDKNYGATFKIIKLMDVNYSINIEP